MKFFIINIQCTYNNLVFQNTSNLILYTLNDFSIQNKK